MKSNLFVFSILFTLLIMPQLVPFFFLNQMFWGYLIILIIIILSSKFVLPRVLSIYLSRMFILKLKK